MITVGLFTLTAFACSTNDNPETENGSGTSIGRTSELVLLECDKYRNGNCGQCMQQWCASEVDAWCENPDSHALRLCMDDCYPCQSACTNEEIRCMVACKDDNACCDGCKSKNSGCNESCNDSDSGLGYGSECLAQCDIRYTDGSRAESAAYICHEKNCLTVCALCSRGG